MHQLQCGSVRQHDRAVYGSMHGTVSGRDLWGDQWPGDIVVQRTVCSRVLLCRRVDDTDGVSVSTGSVQRGRCECVHAVQRGSVRQCVGLDNSKLQRQLQCGVRLCGGVDVLYSVALSRGHVQCERVERVHELQRGSVRRGDRSADSGVQRQLQCGVRLSSGVDQRHGSDVWCRSVQCGWRRCMQCVSRRHVRHDSRSTVGGM